MGGLTLLLFRGVAWIYYFQPFFLRKLWGKTLGRILRALRFRSNVVRQNVEYAKKHLESMGQPFDSERIYAAAYEHLGNLVFEILMLFGPMRLFIEKKGIMRGWEHWEHALQKGKGVIFLSSHVGNWEFMAGIGGIHGKVPVMLVTKHLKPEWLHQAVEKARARLLVSATYEPKTLRDVLGSLKRNGTVGFVLDQYAGPPVGVRVPVFGIPVGTMTAVAYLAKRTGATVLPVMNYRTTDGRVIAEIRAPLEWESHPDPAYEIAVNTARYARELEKDIYAHPDQWLWIHRRFKGDLSELREGEWQEGRPRR